MNVLGIDPGIGRTGWGIVEMEQGKCSTKEFGCLETASSQETPERLLTIYRFLGSIIKKHKPEALAIEDLFFNTNVKTASVVGQARGVILLLAAEHHLSVGIYTPLQVKVAVTGYGRAEKKQVGHMVKVLLRLDTVPKPDDTADALAVALAHAFSQKLSSKIKR